MAEDISRRIDDLLSGAIDEQVREQRALNDIVVGVRDGVSRLVGDVAALSARVTESREASQGLREELPFLVQREVGSATNALSVRIDVLETAIGELVASLAGLEDRVGPEVIIGGISDRLEAMRAEEEDVAGQVTADAARAAVEESADAIRAAFDKTASQIGAMLEKHQTQLAKRLDGATKDIEDLEARLKSLEKGLESVVKMPADVKGRLAELTGSVQDMTDGVLDEIRSSAEASSARVAATVESVERDALEMSGRFNEMTGQMAKFQEEVLAYLQVRDLALEERRDQIVTELLGDFLDTLPQREREKSVGLLRSVFQRRRDRRDAERFRTGVRDVLPRPATPPRTGSPGRAPRPSPSREPLPERFDERPEPRPVAVTEAAPEPVTPASPPMRAARPVLEEMDVPATPEEIAIVEEAPRPKAPAKPTAKKAAPKAKKAAPKPKAATKSSTSKAGSKAAPKPKAAEPAPDAPAAPEPPPMEPAAEAPSSSESLPGTPFTEADAAMLRAELLTDAEEPEPDVEPIELTTFEPHDEAIVAPAGKDEAEVAVPPEPPARVSKPKPPAKPRKAKASAKPKTTPAEVAAEAQPAAPSAPEPPAPPEDAVPDDEPDDDTLSQALQRVQALVDQHRQPRGGRKRAR